MTRIKSIPFAIGAVILSAGSVFAFTAMPAASGPGLAKAGTASGHTVPARDASDNGDQGQNTDADAPETETPDTDAPDGDTGPAQPRPGARRRPDGGPRQSDHQHQDAGAGRQARLRQARLSQAA